jgi:uncharacterized delta-60 repeat protein
VQGDGKIVAAGGARTATFGLARYNPDGSLDTTFGTGGTVTTAIGTTHDVAYAIALQGDGKILAAGVAETATQKAFELVRYNPDGSLDATFGSGGSVTTAIGTTHDVAYAMAVQRDGKIVAAGGARTATHEAFAVARYLGETTTLPCTTARCTLGAAPMSPMCAGQRIPAGVTGKFSKAESLIDQAATSSAKKAPKLRHRARTLLRQAGAMAMRAAKDKGRKAKISAACAAALKAAAGGVATGL